MNSFFLGVAASIVAALVLMPLANRDDVWFLISARRKYTFIRGDWKHFHLSVPGADSPPGWAKSHARLNVSSFGHVTGKFVPDDSSFSPEYAIRGAIRNGVMRLRLNNVQNQEEPVTITFPTLRRPKVLLGMWVGQVGDERWTSGPSILAREEVSQEWEADDLDREALALRILAPSQARLFVRYFPGEDSAQWSSHLGRTEVEMVRDGKGCRCVLAGIAIRDGTDKLVYGPFETLPLPGRYRVTFRLAVACPSGTRARDEVVRLDVYGNDRAIAARFLCHEDLKPGYGEYYLDFMYDDVKLKLEYRVALLKREVSGRLYDITVERHSPRNPNVLGSSTSKCTS